MTTALLDNRSRDGSAIKSYFPCPRTLRNVWSGRDRGSLELRQRQGSFRSARRAATATRGSHRQIPSNGEELFPKDGFARLGSHTRLVQYEQTTPLSKPRERGRTVLFPDDCCAPLGGLTRLVQYEQTTPLGKPRATNVGAAPSTIVSPRTIFRLRFALRRDHEGSSGFFDGVTPLRPLLL